ncbi:15116_t:CDS:2, partial [Racocetra persica]
FIMSNIEELDEYDKEFDQASMLFSLKFSDNINSIFVKDLSFFDNIRGPKMASPSFIYNNNETEDNKNF